MSNASQLSLRFLLKKFRGVPRVCLTILPRVFGKRINTNCPRVWDSVFITITGEVFCCCGGMPGESIGNINRETLGRIWKYSLPLKEVWLRSRFGCLNCFHLCMQLTGQERAHPSSRRHPAAYPRVVHIEYGTACNFNCAMCWQDRHSGITLDNEVLRRNIDWSRVEEVILQGGEIFMIKSAMEFYWWLVRDMRKKVSVAINGSLMTDEIAESLLRTSGRIAVSVNAVTDKTHEAVTGSRSFDKVIAHIKMLVDLKKRSGSPADIAFHFTMCPDNVSEAPEAILFAQSLGCDIVSYSHALSVSPFLTSHPEVQREIKKRLKDILESGQVHIRMEERDFEKLGILDAPFFGVIPI